MLVGIVGSPNSGKSTFFKALTLTNVEIANYPFTTIKANQGIGYVTTKCPCKKLRVSCKPQNSRCVNGLRMIPVRLLDVAGLVPGAHMGKGLGNQFLDDLRQAQGLIHVLDISGKTDSEGKARDGFNPEETIRVLGEEIDLWLKDIIDRSLDKLLTRSKTEKIPLERLLGEKLTGLGISEDDVKQALKVSEPGTLEFTRELRKISKPILIAANKIDLLESKENFERLKRGYKIVPCSAESELALREASSHNIISYIPGGHDFTVNGSLNEKQKQALDFIKKNVLDVYSSTGVQDCLNEMFLGLLNMIAVYPVANINKLSDTKGNVLPDVFLVPKGTTLKEFAGKVHTDLAENFIGGLNLERKKIGADYELKDGDVVEILFK